MVGQEQRDAAVAFAERFDADPDDFAGRRSGDRGRRARSPRRAPAGSRVSSIDAGSGAPCSCSIASSSASRPPRGAARSPCHVSVNRPSAPRSTGSTCLPQPRQRALPQRAQDVGVAPFALEAARPELALRRRGPLADSRRAAIARRRPTPRPNRAAQSARRERPVRARVAQHQVAERVAHRLAAASRGSPCGSGAPSASRYRAASSTAMKRGCTGDRRSGGRGVRRRAASIARASASELRRARRSRRASRSPNRSSRSCRPSALRTR